MTDNIIHVTADGTLRYRHLHMRCALGKAGVTHDKQEGDLKTPLGRYALHDVYYRQDRTALTGVTLPSIPITDTMGWCDDPTHPEYNRLVTLPFTASHEHLWRKDHRYDLLIPIGYNDNPPVPGKGSAIFLHLATRDYEGTEGCVAISRPDMERLLKHIDAETVIDITEESTGQHEQDSL